LRKKGLAMTFKRLVLLLLGLSAVAAVLGLYVVPAPAESVDALSQKWEGSTHADIGSEAFTHWDEDDPPLIPVACAKCHSTYGFRDFLGEDGSAAGQVDRPAETGTTVYCIACHNPSAHAMTRVGFPSGAEVGGLGREAVCMQCHQGRRASGDVEQAIAGLDEDAVSGDLSFINVHYYIAAATWLGTEAQGGYEYPDRSYVIRFEHVPDVQSCVECHDPHSQAVAWQACSPCHVTVSGFGDLRGIRTGGGDFDGDGDVEEGLYGEIETMQETVYAAMQGYAAQVAGTPIAYADDFPYFVVDTNGNGEADPDEIGGGNAYSAWTPRLLRAAYNYHFSLRDRGNYAHNGRYVLQLLYDSLDDLAHRVSVDAEGPLRPASR
jgi:hypothetical protein